MGKENERRLSLCKMSASIDIVFVQKNKCTHNVLAAFYLPISSLGRIEMKER
jgi:hypothetical protein